MTRFLLAALFFAAVFGSGALVGFGHTAVFPLGMANFFVFSLLAFLFALYRPGWAFLLFVSLLPFETVLLAPHALGISIRPYQLFGAALAFGLGVRFLFRRNSFPFSPLRWFDGLPFLIVLGSIASVFVAPHVPTAAKQTVIVFSYAVMFLVSRQFLSDARDLKNVWPFAALSAVFSAFFALWQSIRFTRSLDSFEVMPGRPNAFFSEPDWLAMFFLVLISGALSFLFWYLEKYFSENGDEFPGREAAVSSRSDSNASSVENTGKQGIGGSFFRQENIRQLVVRGGIFLLLTLFMITLFLTVSRSAWFGGVLAAVGCLAMLLLGTPPFSFTRLRWRMWFRGSLFLLCSLLLSLIAIRLSGITTFALADRAKSVNGWQEITISCETSAPLPNRIEDVAALPSLGCRHIRLEDIEAEALLGRTIARIERPDPSIDARLTIGKETISQLRSHPIFGIGWGNIGMFLGKDERGASYNASNAFLEMWLGGGILAFVAFGVLWCLVPILAIRTLSGASGFPESTIDRALALFFLISWIALSAFNLFNSGVLLGFVWVWLGGIGLLLPKESSHTVLSSHAS